MTTELQQHRYDAMMRRVGDLKGPGSKVAEVLAEVFPIVDLENPPAELYGLGGTALGFGGITVAASVGDHSRVQLFNPISSGKVMIVTTMLVSVGTADGVRYGVVNQPLTLGPGLQRMRDQRFGFTTLPSGQIRTDQTVAAGPATITLTLLADVPFRITDPNGLAVLAPGTGLEISPRSTDIEMSAGFYWRERVMEPSEREL